MEFTPLAIPDVLLLEPNVFGDARGFFFESFNQQRFESAVGRGVGFVQDNHSGSGRNVLRGLHYQIAHPQGKLLRVMAGEIFDVAVDLRADSPTFGRWVSAILSARNRRQMWVPEGFAHGFLVVSDFAEVLYKTTDYWAPQYERCIAWNDRTLGIEWPIQGMPILSARDQEGGAFEVAEVFGKPNRTDA
jgi:dTDP-4-dehydrorhamnose 3,5-epimerase